MHIYNDGYLDLGKSLNPFILERLAWTIWLFHSLLKRKFFSPPFEIAVKHLVGGSSPPRVGAGQCAITTNTKEITGAKQGENRAVLVHRL